MKRWVKWVIGAVAVLVLGAAAAVTAGWQMAANKMARHVDIAPHPIAYIDDTLKLDRGKYLFESRGCADCHGLNGGGRIFVDKPDLRLGGPNITAGGVTALYKPEDWERAIRHGVKPTGLPLMVMPSEDYNRLTDADLSALVSYVRRLPTLKGGDAVLDMPVPMRVLYGFGAFEDAAAAIDHSLPPSQPVEMGVNVKHGAYVANMCKGCHGVHLSGGKISDGPPDWPPAANLTPGDGSVMTARYKDATAFVAMLHSGKRADGSAIPVMPFEALGKLNDVDAQALHAYLLTLPAQAAGGR